MPFSSRGFRFPLTTRPTVEPLDPGRMILEMGGLDFFSLVAAAPYVAAPELILAADGLNIFSLVLLLGAAPPSSACACLDVTGCPDAVLFLSAADSDTVDERSIDVAWSGAGGSPSSSRPLLFGPSW